MNKERIAMLNCINSEDHITPVFIYFRKKSKGEKLFPLLVSQAVINVKADKKYIFQYRVINGDKKLIVSDALEITFKEDDGDKLDNDLFLITGVLKTKEINFIPDEYEIQLDLLDIDGKVIDSKSTYVFLQYE